MIINRIFMGALKIVRQMGMSTIWNGNRFTLLCVFRIVGEVGAKLKVYNECINLKLEVNTLFLNQIVVS